MSLLFFAGSLIVGSVTLSFEQIVSAFEYSKPSLAATIIWELRFPRSLTAFVAGALLALAGTYQQALLRNPLADPYILGVSGGASVAALLAIGSGVSSFGVSLSAFVGALFSMVLVFVLARGRGVWSSTRLLLTGVVIASGWGALISLILSLSPNTQLKGMLFWLMGDLSESRIPFGGGVILLLGLVYGVTQARNLNLLLRGEQQAQLLGLELNRLRFGLYVVTALLTATAVTLVGNIGFIGLVVPHILRLALGSDHRLLIPGVVIAGGGLLLLADTVARSVIAPQQLPTGVITALIGVPMFLYLLNREQR